MAERRLVGGMGSPAGTAPPRRSPAGWPVALASIAAARLALGAAIGGAALLAAVLLLPPGMAAAASVTLTVSGTGDSTTGTCSGTSCSTLRAAVAQANTDAGNGDAVTINVPAGTYILTQGELDVAAYLTVQSNCPNVTQSITITGNTAQSTVIDQGTANSRVFTLDPNVCGNVDVALQNLTITGGNENGNSTDPYAPYGGAGILAGGPTDTLTLTDCVITGNQTSTSNGGGINFFGGGTLSISGTTFSDNSTQGDLNAPAGSPAGTPTGGGSGGAILFGQSTSLTVTDSTFIDNTASTISGTSPTVGAGGAINFAGGTASITGSLFSGNTADNQGGAFYVLNSTNFPSSVTATDDWWGCNAGANGGAPGCDTTVNSGGTLTTSPYLTLAVSSSTNSVSAGGTATITANFTKDSAGTTVAGVPDGTQVSFSATGGTMSPSTAATSGGKAQSTFTAGSTGGSASASARLDSATVNASLTVAQSSAPDGSGTMQQTGGPSSVGGGSTPTLTFTYTAATGGTSSGEMQLTIPPGWTAPSTTNVTVNGGAATAGEISASAVTVSGVTLAAGGTLTIAYTGTAPTPSSAPAITSTFTTAEASIGGDTPIVLTAGSPQVTVYAPDGSGTMTQASGPSSVSGGASTALAFTYTAADGGTSNGEVKLTIPTGWTAPSTSNVTVNGSAATAGEVSASAVTVSGVTLAAGGTLTIGYTGRAPTPSTAAASTSTFTTAEASVSGDTPVVLAVGSPQVTVYAPDGSGTLTQTSGPSSVAGGATPALTFTYKVANGGIRNGIVRLTVPSGWTPPSLSNVTVNGGPGTMGISGSIVTIGVGTLLGGNSLTIGYTGTAPTPSSASAITSTFTTAEASIGSDTPVVLTAGSPQVTVYAPDGSGTMTQASGPSSVSGGASTALAFSYTAASGGTSNGEVKLTIPAGWTAPSTSNVAVNGSAATGGEISASAVTVSGVTLAAGGTLTIAYTGTAPTPSSAPAIVSTFTTAEASVSGDTPVTLSGPLPQVTVYAPDGSGTAAVGPSSVTAGAAGPTLTLSYTAAPGGVSDGEVQVAVPAGWTAPSTSNVTIDGVAATAGEVGGGDITVPGLTLPAGQTLTILFGGPGVTAPATAGTSTFTTSERSTSSGNLTPLPSSSQPIVQVGAGSPASVALSETSASVPAGSTLTVSGAVYDASNNPVPGASVSLSVSPAGAGTLPPAGTTGGGGAFSLLYVAPSTPGPVTLTASAGGVHSSPLDVTVTTTLARHLVWLAAPGDSTAGQPFAAQPQLALEDSLGNLVKVDTAAITLSIAKGTGTSGASLSGTASEPLSAGVASFNGLAIDQVGQGYVLVATDAADGNLTADSPAFDVAAGGAAQIRLFQPATPDVVMGGTDTVSGVVYDGTGNPVPGAAVTLTAAAAGTGSPAGTIASSTVTGGNGSFSATFVAPDAVGAVTLQARAGPASASTTVDVTAGQVAAVSISLAPSLVTIGTPGDASTLVSGQVANGQGSPVPAQVTLVATSPGFAGATVSATVYADVYGHYQATFTPAAGSSAPVLLTASVPGYTPASAVLAVAAAPAADAAQGFTAGNGGVVVQSPAGSPIQTTVDASGGPGAADVLSYGADPEAVPGPGGASRYLDVGLSAGNGFTSASLQLCGLAGGPTAYWWDGTAWQPFAPQGVVGGCLDIGPLKAAGTSPTLSELSGTPIAVASAMTAGDTLTWSPAPLAATAGLAAGQAVTATVSAEDAAGNPLPKVAIYLSFVPAPGGGTAAVGGTALTATPRAFAADGSGQVQVTYTVPATLPSGGTDALTAASAAANPVVAATDSYTYAAPARGVTATGGSTGALPAPTVGGVSPDSGPAAGGTTVTVTGAHFTGAAAVDFGGVAATFTVDSDGEITATAPPGTGTVDVTVTTSAGTSATGPADRFAYAVPTSQTAPAAPAFSDVPPTYWAYTDIEALAARGIVNGFPDGTFRPEAPLSRAQFVKMLDLTLGMAVAPGSVGAPPFADVPPAAWYAPYVDAAARAGIAEGTSPATFAPEVPVTREEMAVLLARALKLTGTATLRFSDAGQIAPWARAGVEGAVAAGYINGLPDGTLAPAAPATRAQAATVLALVLSRSGS